MDWLAILKPMANADELVNDILTMHGHKLAPWQTPLGAAIAVGVLAVFQITVTLLTRLKR